jgi:hypothetical protein
MMQLKVFLLITDETTAAMAAAEVVAATAVAAVTVVAAAVAAMGAAGRNDPFLVSIPYSSVAEPVFLGLLDPDPLVRGDPDPSINKQKG